MPYYKVSADSSLKFETKNRGYLKLLVRGEFKHNMFSDNTVRLHLKENGKVIYTIQISSKRSKSVVYEHGGKLIPGTLNKFYLETPKGNHEYELVVADKRKSVLVKIATDKRRFPKKRKKTTTKKGKKKKKKKASKKSTKKSAAKKTVTKKP